METYGIRIYSHASNRGMTIVASATYMGIDYTLEKFFTWPDWEAMTSDQCYAARERVGYEMKSKLAALKPLALPQVGTQWRHKSGTVYLVLHVTTAPDPEKAAEFPITVIYEGPDGRTWPRTLPRWYASMTEVKEEK